MATSIRKERHDPSNRSDFVCPVKLRSTQQNIPSIYKCILQIHSKLMWIKFSYIFVTIRWSNVSSHTNVYLELNQTHPFHNTFNDTVYTRATWPTHSHTQSLTTATTITARSTTLHTRNQLLHWHLSARSALTNPTYGPMKSGRAYRTNLLAPLILFSTVEHSSTTCCSITIHLDLCVW